MTNNAHRSPNLESLAKKFNQYVPLNTNCGIVNYYNKLETQRLLVQFIESVKRTVGGLAHELIVVDNGSSDKSLEIIRANFPDVRLIANQQNLGFSKSVNLAIAASSGDFILIAHPDIVFQQQAIEKLIARLKSSVKVGCVGANCVYPDGTFNRCAMEKRSIRREIIDFGFPLNFLDTLITSVLAEFGKQRRPIYWDHLALAETWAVWNACMMLKRNVLDDIGGFDESFFVWFADTDWCYRARLADYQVFYVPEARVVHYEVQSGNFVDGSLVGYKTNSLVVTGLMGRDLSKLLKKHYSLGYRIMSICIRSMAIGKAYCRVTFVKFLEAMKKFPARIKIS